MIIKEVIVFLSKIFDLVIVAVTFIVLLLFWLLFFRLALQYSKLQCSINNFIIHSKYFRISDWLKSHI